MNHMTNTYKSAGVDIHQITKSHMKIGEIITSTHNVQKSSKVLHGFGHYAGIVKAGGQRIATHTDGVGTKVLIANLLKKYDTIGIDCVAMNVNDIICIGATPISFVDYVAINQNNRQKLAKIMQGLVVGAKKGMVPIIGGETAVMPDLISGKGFSFDLAGTVVGILGKDVILGNSIKRNDIIIGAASSGLHSNGFSLARKVLFPKFKIHDKVNRIGGIGKALLTPTEIYVKPVLEIIKKSRVHGLAHITGGAFTKLLRLKQIGYQLDDIPKASALFGLIEEQGVSNINMYKTFNMGIGFCVISPQGEEQEIIKTFKKHKIKSSVIGRIVQKRGVFINSKRIA